MARIHHFIKLLIFILNASIILTDNDKCAVEKADEEPAIDTQIREHVLCDYDRTIRPVTGNLPTNLTFVFLASKIYYSDYSGYAEVDGTLILTWVDEHLSWEPSDYGNVKKIYLDTSEIWMPDLSVYNNGPYSSKEILGSTECSVYFNKKVICFFQSSISGMCTPDFRHWPYDVQNCTIKIGSWYHAGSELDYSLAFVKKNMMLYEESSEWNLNSISIKIDPGIYKKFPNETFPSIKINILMSRNIRSVAISLILPFFVIVSITLITLSFDPRTSDRIYFSVFNIPCHIMFLLDTTWNVPEGPMIPYIILCLRNSLVLAAIILIESVIVRYFLNKNGEKPAWLVIMADKVTDFKIGKLLLYKEYNSKVINEETASSNETETVEETREKPSEWYIFGKLIDMLFCIIVILLYLISFLICIA